MLLSEFLNKQREKTPSWLKRFSPGDAFNNRAFFSSRIVYYPGSAADGQPVRLFGASHSAHCFIYADYDYDNEQWDVQLTHPKKGFLGYHSIARVAVDEKDIFPRGWEPRKQKNGQFNQDAENGHQPPFLEILERDSDFEDSHGPDRLAILFLCLDGISSYDGLFCQRGRAAPFVAVIQDHGFGGNYDRFGQAGLMELAATQSNRLPEWLLVADDTDPWNGYFKIPDVAADIGGMHGNQRFIWGRDQSMKSNSENLMNLSEEEAKLIAKIIEPIFHDVSADYDFDKYPADDYMVFKRTFSYLSKSNEEIAPALEWKWGHYGKESYPESHRSLIREVQTAWPAFVNSDSSSDPTKTFNWWKKTLISNTRYITVAYITHLIHSDTNIPIIDQHNFRGVNYLLSQVREGHKGKQKPSQWADVLFLKSFMETLLPHLPGIQFGELDRFLMMYGRKAPRKHRSRTKKSDLNSRDSQAMKNCRTLGPGLMAVEFQYSGSIRNGVEIKYGNTTVKVSSEFLKQLLSNFKGQKVTAGVIRDNPAKSGFGEWIQDNSYLNTQNLNPQHGSRIAGILVKEGYAKYENNPTTLIFD